ncbi:ABC transporter permease [Acidimicrobiaceae bacterium AH-315-P05]|nr:ABC transporter permease [Acidimicrobiaceae bacterium AH-315-P05]
MADVATRDQTKGTDASEQISTSTARRVAFGFLFWISLGWICLVLLAALASSLANWFDFDLPGLKDPNRINPADRLLPVRHVDAWLGSDALGRDNLARLVEGARVSVTISVITVAVGIVIGGFIGTAVGFYRGTIERLTMGAVNVALSFPSLVLLLGVVAMVGSSLVTLTVVFSILAIPGYIRFARASTLSLMQQEWVTASSVMGATDRRIITRVLLPNVLVTLITFGLLALGGVIVAEGTLAFLGFGIPVPQASWGRMIADGKPHLNDSLSATLVPATAMFMTILSLNLIGDGLRRRFSVRDSRI